MRHPYPNQMLLGIVDGRRPPVLPPADVDWSGVFSRTPTTVEPARETEAAERTLKWPSLPQSPRAQDECIIPGLFGGCLISRETGILLGVNAVLALALLIGGLMLLTPVAARGVTIVTGTTPAGHVRRAIRAQKEAPSGG